MGTIHLAVAGGLADFRKLLVVKELRQDLSANQRFVEMFLDEARLAARLNHPNVVQTVEAGQEGDRYFLSMEFLDGQPYSAIWGGAGRFPQISLPIRLKILCDALAGLHYAHTLTEYDGTRLHIVHRDVSPQNIFVTYDGQVKVVDFGIAKASVSSTMTSPGIFKGKFGYAAPEQVRGEEVDARTDVFAMGVILWEALTMQRFCDGVAGRASVAARLAGTEPRLAQILPQGDHRLTVICDRALSIDPDARFESAEAFRGALEAYIAQSGQRVEASSIQKVLVNKFAAERRTVHQLIDRHLKHGAVEESHVSQVELGTEGGDNNPTQIADLSNLVRNTNETVVDGVLDLPQVSPEKPARKVSLAVAAALAASAVGLTLGYMHLTSMREPGHQPAQAATVEATPAIAPTNSAPRAASDAVPTPTNAVAPAAANSGQALGAEVGEAEVDPVARSGAQAPQTAQDDGPRAPERAGSRRVVVRPRAVVAARPSVEPQAAPAAEPVAPRAEPVAPKPPVESGVGSDLNRMGRSDHRRSIDTDL